MSDKPTQLNWITGTFEPVPDPDTTAPSAAWIAGWMDADQYDTDAVNPYPDWHADYRDWQAGYEACMERR